MMINYEVRQVVCDYGIYEEGKLIPELIMNSRANALLICEILRCDDEHRVFQNVKTAG